MGWAFLFAVAALVAWLFTESATRIIAIGLIAFIAAVSLLYFLVLDQPERREAQTPARETQERVAEELLQRQAQSQNLIKPADIALLKRTLKSGTDYYWGADGQRMERPDLFDWTFSGEIKNGSPAHTVKDLDIRIRLYSCPTYFSTPVEQAVITELSRNCNQVGERIMTLYGLNLAPNEARGFDEKVNLNNRIEPRNWRYWADVTRVVSQAE